MPKIAKLFKEKGVKKILDLGCGTGRHLVYLIKHGFEVYGFDIAPEGIRITKNWLKREKLKADLKIGDIYKTLPYQNSFFDAIISTNVLHHNKIVMIKKLIKEMSRILKPKGLIFITVRNRQGFRKDKRFKITIEEYNKRSIKYKIIDSRTYVPIDGNEKGLIHFLFNKKLLKKEFDNFKIHDIWLNSDKRHYCLLGELKK